MNTLIYKMTHDGDPDSLHKIWGVQDCMGSIRGRQYDAVIGVGGKSFIGHENKLVWVGIAPHHYAFNGFRGPVISFNSFNYFGQLGPDLNDVAPALSQRLSSVQRGALISSNESSTIQTEIASLLKHAVANSSVPSQLNLNSVKNTEKCSCQDNLC